MEEKYDRLKFFKKIGEEIIPTLAILGLTLNCSSNNYSVNRRKNNLALLCLDFQNDSLLIQDNLRNYDNQRKVIDYLFENVSDLDIYLGRNLSSRNSGGVSPIEDYLLTQSGNFSKKINSFNVGSDKITNLIIQDMNQNEIEKVILIGKKLKEGEKSFEDLIKGLNKKGILVYSSKELVKNIEYKDINHISDTYQEMFKKLGK
jgi:hypothetical protein